MPRVIIEHAPAATAGVSGLIVVGDGPDDLPGTSPLIRAAAYGAGTYLVLRKLGGVRMKKRSPWLALGIFGLTLARG